jgi:protein-S-isoprenylcysteine O-methyltransferase Ste14
MGKKAWALTRTAVFTLVVPGTVAGYIPYTLIRNRTWEWPPVFIWCATLPLFALGLALYLSCAWRFAVDGLGTPAPIDPPRTLVVRGPYRFTRNPMYVAVLSVLAGEALAARSTALAAYGALVFACFFGFVVAYEEPVLRSTFGGAYDAYRASVPRWIPAWTRDTTAPSTGSSSPR